ncbi:phosphonate ABC transporter, permease protein PhnE [Marinicrinis lubricantis]|uniref:Phosphonate ABC transporter, permease protein PhnE n=1 Tax=Marinicrinis lubricantis TaxID=2086470 RepID=A0ABW1IKY1_9BACL
MKTAIQNQLNAAPSRVLYYTVTLTIFLILLIWSAAALDLKLVDESGRSIAAGIIWGLLQPDLDLLFDFSSKGVLYLLAETVAIAFLGTVIGAFLAIPFAFLSASNIVSSKVSFLFRILLIVIRTVPALVYGLMFIRVTGPGAFAGVLTISLASIGMLSKLYADAIENLDTRVFESMSSMGCSTFEKIRYGIIPQLFSIFLSIVIYRFDMNLREASILGLVQAGGIGAPLIFAMNAYRWSEAGSILIGLILLILLTELFSNKMRSKLIKG